MLELTESPYDLDERPATNPAGNQMRGRQKSGLSLRADGQSPHTQQDASTNEHDKERGESLSQTQRVR